MMRWLLLFMLWLGASSAQAQQVAVTTGDHPGFTRVVLEAQGLTGWRLVRLTDGYALHLRRQAAFDLDQAFRVITQDRLTAISPLADGRGLRLALGCTCHAVGFDYRPGVVVIDLRDGPPPDGSSFELTEAGDPAPPLRRPDLPVPRPVARPADAWDWTRQALSVPPPIPSVSAGPLPGPQVLELQESLLRHMADGAARGLVDPVVRLPAARAPASSPPDAARLGLLALPGISGLTAQAESPNLTAAGAECLAPERINLPDWGDPDIPGSAQMATMTTFLGEFDRPDPAALALSVRRHLWLGFGVEAMALVDAFATDAADAALWRGMARLVDGTADPGGPFTGMTMCDGPAALWAAMADPDISLPEVNRPAILRSFSALPPHLRRSLGPALAEKFLTVGDGTTAQSLRDAMLRGDPTAGTLLDARIALRADQPERAEAAAEAAVAAGGPDGAAALVTLTEARFQARKPAPPADVTALAAMWQEQPDDPALARATVLAQALSGAYDAAFADLARSSGTLQDKLAPDLWALLAETGPDSALITHAILPDEPPPRVAPATGQLLAKRLTDLGFGMAAQVWLGADGDPTALATADLADGNARAALTRLAGRPGQTAAAIRARALLDLGDADAAAKLLTGEAAGDPAQTLAAHIRSRAWDYLGQNGPDTWQKAAAELQPTRLSGGPLTDGRAILTQSAATRAAVSALLESGALDPSADDITPP